MHRKMEAYIVLAIVVLGTLGAGLLTISYRTHSLANQKKLEEKTNKIEELGKTIDSQTVKNTELNIELVDKTNENMELTKKTNVLGERNQHLNEELKKLSLRLGDQSKVIEEQITGGKAYAKLEFKSSSVKYGQRSFGLLLKNEFSTSILNPQINFFRIQRIYEKCSKGEFEEKKAISSECYEFYRSNLDTRPIDSGVDVQFGGSVIYDDKDQENYYQLTMFQKNGTFYYKIYVDRDETKIMGYVVQIEKDKNILERYSKSFFTEHIINESTIDFDKYYKHLYNPFMLVDK